MVLHAGRLALLVERHQFQLAAIDTADVAALGALPYSQDGFGPTLEDVRKGLIGKIGENIQVRRYVRMDLGG